MEASNDKQAVSGSCVSRDDRLRRKDVIAITLLVLLALAFRVIGMKADKIYFDEAITILVSERDDVGEVLDTLRDQTYPPLYYLVMHGWLKVVGRELWLIPLPSVVFGVATIPMLVLFGWELFRRKSVAYLAGILLAVFPFHIHASQEIRAGSLVCFLGLTSTYFLLRLSRSQDAKSKVMYGLSTVLLLYTHYVSIFLVLAHCIYIFLWKREKLKEWLLVAGCVAVLAAPLGLLLVNQVTMVEQTGYPGGNLLEVIRAAVYYAAGKTWLLAAGLGIGLAVLAFSVRFLWLAGKERIFFFLQYLLFPVLLTALFSVFCMNIMRLRNVVYILPAITLALSCAPFASRKRLLQASVIILLIVVHLGGYAVWMQKRTRLPTQEIANFLLEEYASGDVVVHDDYFLSLPLHVYLGDEIPHYYFRSEGPEYDPFVHGLLPGDSVLRSEGELLPLLAKAHKILVVTGSGELERIVPSTYRIESTKTFGKNRLICVKVFRR